MNNRAAWLRSKGSTFHVAEAPYPIVQPSHIIIKNAAISINPIDWKVQQNGLYIRNWPAILGNDTAGEVVEVGSEVSNIKKGDRVIAYCLPLASGRPQEGSFQAFTSAPAALCCPIPDFITYEEASVIPLSISTAAAGLYSKSHLDLPWPTANAVTTNKTILVWGGSSSVGCSVIQLATACGLLVVATASASNFSFVKALGAKAVFDRTSPTVTDDIIGYMEHAQLVGVYDCIGLPETTLACANILSSFGGGRIASVNVPPSELPEGVTANKVFSPIIKDNGVANAVWATFLPQALREGRYKPWPKPMIFGKGLESVQGAVDTLKKGVSASKVVVVM